MGFHEYICRWDAWDTWNLVEHSPGMYIFCIFGHIEAYCKLGKHTGIQSGKSREVVRVCYFLANSYRPHFRPVVSCQISIASNSESPVGRNHETREVIPTQYIQIGYGYDSKCIARQNWPISLRSIPFFSVQLGRNIDPVKLQSIKVLTCFDLDKYWLVVWNMAFIFPYIGNNHPNWLIFFRGGETTNQNIWKPPRHHGHVVLNQTKETLCCIHFHQQSLVWVLVKRLAWV